MYHYWCIWEGYSPSLLWLGRHGRLCYSRNNTHRGQQMVMAWVIIPTLNLHQAPLYRTILSTILVLTPPIKRVGCQPNISGLSSPSCDAFSLLEKFYSTDIGIIIMSVLLALLATRLPKRTNRETAPILIGANSVHFFLSPLANDDNKTRYPFVQLHLLPTSL